MRTSDSIVRLVPSSTIAMKDSSDFLRPGA